MLPSRSMARTEIVSAAGAGPSAVSTAGGLPDERLGRRTFIEAVAAVRRNQTQRTGQVAIAEDLARFRRFAVGQVRQLRVLRRRQLPGGTFPPGADDLGNGETVFGIV